MNPISKANQRIFDHLVADLPVGEARTINNAPGVFMPLHVERLTESRYSLAHYFEQNGDLVADPDGEFYRADSGRVFPSALQLCTGHYTRALEFGGDDELKGYRPRALRELNAFARVWLQNIKRQQLSRAA
jgi:hypothetical protein